MRKSVKRGLVFLAVLEAIAFVALGVRDGSWQLAGGRWLGAETNHFLRAMLEHSAKDCLYSDLLLPHPYLGFVYDQQSACRGGLEINSLGFLGREPLGLPHPDDYVILFTGGSLANQLNGMTKQDQHYVEDGLNRRFFPPRGSRFVVLNWGSGGFKQPQQLITYLLYQHWVDAVVTLDGASEFRMLFEGHDFLWPSNEYPNLNPRVAADFSQVIRGWVVGRAYWGVARFPVLRQSSIAFLALSTLRKWMKAQELYAKGSYFNLFRNPGEAPPRTAEDRMVRGAEEYRRFSQSMDGAARANRHPIAHFLTPVPALFKKIHPLERAVVGNLEYGPLYSLFARETLQAGPDAVPVHDLTRIFEDVSGPIYQDEIHYRRENGRSAGYEILGRNIVDLLARDWKLKAKPLADR